MEWVGREAELGGARARVGARAGKRKEGRRLRGEREVGLKEMSLQVAAIAADVAMLCCLMRGKKETLTTSNQYNPTQSRPQSKQPPVGRKIDPLLFCFFLCSFLVDFLRGKDEDEKVLLVSVW